MEYLNANPAVALIFLVILMTIVLGLILSSRIRALRRTIREGDRHMLSRMQEITARSEADNTRMIDAVQRIHQMTESMSAHNEERLKQLVAQVGVISETNLREMQALRRLFDERQERLTKSVSEQLTALQTSNEQRLDQMRETVDHRLQATLNKRLGDSFQQVIEQLERVHKGLGEMQSLASGVGDLKKVLSGVKTRGIWGEVRLKALLEQNLTANQFSENVAVDPKSRERVEFTVLLPGRTGEAPVHLPIDSKFPQADFERLIDASERGDKEEADRAAVALEKALTLQAKDISAKYIKPPHTTDFAILFLPVESLYAEALRRPGLVDQLQTKYRVMVSGPTTLSSLLTSLQMGFRTLAVEQRSAEIWRLLGSVKEEFIRFGDVLDKTKQRLEQATNELDNASRRTRSINRKLRDVEEAEGGFLSSEE